ncbi:MAG: DUF6447 family protein [Thiomicrorhabdus sp.]|jgi:hypothetical protein|nr:DUF6447 family protein [Thiomicrorhabdus sp.]
MTEQKEGTLKINDKEYKMSELSNDAKAQLQSARFADTEIQRLNMQLALVQTARNAYQKALLELLPQD